MKSVQILNYLTGKGNEIGGGAGVFVCPDILVTAFHVIDEFTGSVRDKLFFLDPFTGKKIPITTIVGLDEKHDLAALKAKGYEPESCYSVNEPFKRDVRLLDKVTLFGFDEDFKSLEIPGYMEEEVFYKNNSFWLVRTSLYDKYLAGMSGAPVFSKLNQLMGIVIHDFKMDVVFVNRWQLKNFLDQDKISCTSHHCIYEENKRLQAQAESGDGIAQVQMGFRHFRANNFSGAVKWYKRAAVEHQIPVAYYNMGFINQKGYGIPKNDAKAISWYNDAAKKEVTLADYATGYIYYQSEIFNRAAHHFLNARNYPLAEYAIGFMLETGKGFKKNIEKAKIWYEKAAQKGHPRAIKKLKELGE
ncbi:MAG: bifunctional trypsin-like peptidase domain-containing/SEL1-like repeat protein [Bdellovibrionales bacterium]|nr:bifunctional trypsin-like peptidase domain-containing/SEL1-like repeat protein [Bdellovibrionales bacterium]